MKVKFDCLKLSIKEPSKEIKIQINLEDQQEHLKADLKCLDNIERVILAKLP